MAAQVLVIESFRWHVTASGTRIQLTEKQSPFTVALFIMGPQLGAALCVSTPFHSYLQCHFNAISMPFQCRFNAIAIPHVRTDPTIGRTPTAGSKAALPRIMNPFSAGVSPPTALHKSAARWLSKRLQSERQDWLIDRVHHAETLRFHFFPPLFPFSGN